MLHSYDSCAGSTIISPILQTRRRRQEEAKFIQLVSGRGKCPWCPVQLQTSPRVICRQILDMLRAFSGLLECVSLQSRHDGQGGETSGQPSMSEGRVPASSLLRRQVCCLLHTLEDPQPDCFYLSSCPQQLPVHTCISFLPYLFSHPCSLMCWDHLSDTPPAPTSSSLDLL